MLSRYEEIGLIDDEHFAEVLTRTRFTQKRASRRAIAAELEQKGVDREIIERVITQIDPDSEFQAAVELASKKAAGRRWKSRDTEPAYVRAACAAGL